MSTDPPDKPRLPPAPEGPHVPPYTVLLVPSAEHPELTQEGPWGARPPLTLWNKGSRGLAPHRNHPRVTSALVLVHEGEHLRLGLVQLPEHVVEDVEVALAYVLAGIDDGLQLYECLEDYGTLVFLDKDRAVIDTIPDGEAK